MTLKDSYQNSLNLQSPNLNPQKQRIIKLLREFKKRKKDKPYRWIKLNRPQYDFDNLPPEKKIRQFLGGNKSGKTTIGLIECIKIALGEHPILSKHIPTPNVGWICCPDMLLHTTISIPELLKWVSLNDIQKLPSKNYPHLIFKNGSKMFFKSYEMKPIKYSGANVHYILFDEEPPEDIYKEALPRILAYSGYMFITMTPIPEEDQEGMTWTYDEIYIKATPTSSVAVVEGSIYDNKANILQADIEEFETKYDINERMIRIYGKYREASGKYLHQFREKNIIHPDYIPSKGVNFRGIDVGISVPTACVWVRYCYIPEENRCKIYVYREYAKKEEGISFHAQRIREETKEEIKTSFIDPKSKSREYNNAISVQKSYYDRGIKTILANNDREYGFSKLNDLFLKEELYISSGCPQLIWEIRHYYKKASRKSQDEKDSPRRKADDSIDALRYCIASLPAVIRGTGEEGEIGTTAYKFKNSKTGR